MISRFMMCIAAVVSTSGLMGCATQRATLPPKAKSGLTQISMALSDARAQLKNAVATLKLLDQPGTTIPTTVKDYSRAVERLNQMTDSTRNRLQSADKPDEFFSAWRSDLDKIQDAELREAGQKRYAEARKELERLKTEIDRLRDAYRPYHTSLNDVETYLRNDPTSAGVEQVKLKIRQIVRGEDEVLTKVDVVQEGIQKLLR